ncbi:MAG: NAD(P)/FAD-dependent oxidoreductase [Clostridiales bacterium]|nr:NAD(P)/FAD-dependent oxidoreductase [Clostridiales bacterium]
MKIVIIGAGQGGLQAARTFASGGADISLFEKESRENLCYDWADDAAMSVFSDLKIPLPEGKYCHGECAALVAPFSHKPMQVEVPVEERDWSIERRALSQVLVGLAEDAGAKLNFSTPVDSLLIENCKVRGIIVGGEKIYADLVVDSSGVLSPFREFLPKDYKIQAMPAPDEVFHVYRAIFEPAPGVEPPVEFTKKVYLKHLGESGISWCFLEPDGNVNVLIGRTVRLEKGTLDNALNKLREENPIIGTKIVRGETTATIPIRYTLPRMVGEGYAAVGDAAFMTIPLIGSGIANSLRAGDMLASIVLKEKSTGITTLWRYQAEYYKKIAAGNVCVDIIKRMLLGSDPNLLRLLFDNGVIDKEDMQSISSGKALTMTPKKILMKIIKGWRCLGLLIKLKNAVATGEKAEAFARMIPEYYDETAINAWQKTLDGFFGR